MIVNKTLINGSYQPDLSSLDLEKWLILGCFLNKDGNTYTVNLELILQPYEKATIDLIRLRYSVDEELSIQRQKETKPEQYQEYFDFAEGCKMEAKTSGFGINKK